MSAIDINAVRIGPSRGAVLGGERIPAHNRGARTGDSSIARLITSFRSAKILFTAATEDVFEDFRRSPKTAHDVAKRRNWSIHACEVFLDALVPMGFLSKNQKQYSLTKMAQKFLLKDSPESLFHNLCYQDFLSEEWSNLPDVLRSGRPRNSLLRLLENPGFTKSYILATREISARASREVAHQLAAPTLRSMLDVGAGHGSYSAALLEKCPNLKATLLDMPGTIRVAKSVLRASPHTKRVQFMEGNYHKTGFGEKIHDLVLLSHVTHDEGPEENLRLIRKAYESLAPGGKIAIHDFIDESDQHRSFFGALFAVHMLIYTERGRVYTKAEYAKWLGAAGFQNIQLRPICSNANNSSALFTAEKLH